jgi:hypothetical protein
MIYDETGIDASPFRDGPSRPRQERTNAAMDSTLTAEGSVSSDGKLVVFVVFARGRAVQCSISRDVLEQYFWAPIGANDARLLNLIRTDTGGL